MYVSNSIPSLSAHAACAIFFSCSWASGTDSLSLLSLSLLCSAGVVTESAETSALVLPGPKLPVVDLKRKKIGQVILDRIHMRRNIENTELWIKNCWTLNIYIYIPFPPVDMTMKKVKSVDKIIFFTCQQIHTQCSRSCLVHPFGQMDKSISNCLPFFCSSIF